MKTINTFYLALFLVFSFACSSDDEPLTPTGTPVTVEFPADLSVMEEAENHEIFINFNRPAPSDGILTVKLKSGEDVDFTTVPALKDGEFEIDVNKGDTRASFFLVPGENATLEENKSLTFELVQGTQGFLLGNKKLLNITITEDEQAAKADFSSLFLTYLENNPEAIDVEVDILGEAPGEGILSIQVEGDPVGDLFTTIPALDANNEMNVLVPSGATRVGFQIILKDNATLKAHHSFTFKIVAASGAVIKGDQSTMSFKLLDDELHGKPKSSETEIAGSKVTKTVEYDALGRISKIKTESHIPNYYYMAENYSYNSQGQLEYISSFAGDFDNFIYSDGKVVKTEKIRGFIKTGYSLFEYNTSGKLIKKMDFEVKTSGEELLKGMHNFTYYNDGNINTQTYSIPGPQNTWQLISTRTYSTYSTQLNPFPLEVLPNQPLQTHFAGMMDVEENGKRTSYYYALDYNAEGFVVKRRSTYETVTYTYY